ncbi:major facilitator superfamily domain-containing protein [Trichoderma austrokoningii]
MIRASITSSIATLAALAALAASETVHLNVARSAPASSSPPISLEFQSFSIEFAFLVDFNGNKSHPNKFTNNLLANLRAFNGDVPQILRIGGNTQDHVTYFPDQKEQIINFWDLSYNSDQPRNTSIGPTFWEAFTAIEGTKYIFGLNFYKNDSTYLENLRGEVAQSLLQIPPERLHLFEIGNENDYGALSGFRPPTWTQQDWVDEWVYRSQNIQIPTNLLRFFAPSTCCYNITTPYSFFSPWTIWNSTFDYDRDGWIAEVSQHGVGTLMNHTSVVINGTIHQSLCSLNHNAGRIYTLGETNSVSGQGAFGVSNVFGSALFVLDYELYFASFGVNRIHMHQGTAYRYSAWMPISQNGTGPSTNHPYYGHIMVSKFIGSNPNTRINNIDLNTEAAPSTTFTLSTGRGSAKYATVELMTAPGALSETNITVAGISYDYDLAEGKPLRVAKLYESELRPNKQGEIYVSVRDSQATVGLKRCCGFRMATDETTPLLPGLKADQKKGFGASVRGIFTDVENRILAAGFLICVAFSYTQVPLMYVFHLMVCDEYYDRHPPFEGPGQRCSRDEIAAGTAAQFSILGMSTTLCGTLNLFLAGWTVKKIGPRAALMIQTFVPAIRVLAQILGVIAGKRTGMLIIQSTQLFTIVGGPAGYILVTNIIASELVEPYRRTVVFGKLQGSIMLGQSIGYLAGGMIGDAIDIRAPFDVACITFLIACVYVRFGIPYISPESMSNKKPGRQGIAGFFAPLKILVPQRMRSGNGSIKKHYGVVILCAGIFLGVLATDYAPLLIQMYATAAFDFDQADNGWLMSEFSFMRSIFLILLFPRIINFGRHLMKRASSPAPEDSDDSSISTSDTQLPTKPGDFDVAAGEQTDVEPTKPPSSAHHREVGHFDLIFLRWSLVIDGALTTVAAFATKRWHIYLAAFLLPFGSGSAPAAKGVITDMCSESQRADALNAVTLVENIARLSTQGLFGFVFSSLAGVGKAYITFFCNAVSSISCRPNWRYTNKRLIWM